MFGELETSSEGDFGETFVPHYYGSPEKDAWHGNDVS